MRVVGSGIDAQITKLHAGERTARQHALDGLFDDPLRELAVKDRLCGALKRGGFLTRDSRVVERKKYGKAKARRSFQFSKR